MIFSARKGFTLIELLIIISIIAVLSLIGLVVFTNILDNARSRKLTADFDAMYKNIEQARVLKQKPLGQITGNYCSDCGGCRSASFSDPAQYAVCLNTMTISYGNVTTADLPLDPWGDPYYFDENEGEGGVSCSKDSIRSAGSDRIAGNSDDKGYSVPLGGYTGCTN